MNSQHVIAMLRKLEVQAGSQSAAARQLQVSNTYYNEVIRGRKEPAGKMLQALGLERVVTYRRKPKGAV